MHCSLVRAFTVPLSLKPLSRHRMHDHGWLHDKGKWCVSHSDANRESNSSAEWFECATCPCNKQTLCKCHTRDKNPDRTKNSQQHAIYTWSLTSLLYKTLCHSFFISLFTCLCLFSSLSSSLISLLKAMRDVCVMCFMSCGCGLLRLWFVVVVVVVEWFY